MDKQRLIGIDIDIGSNSNPTYAVYLLAPGISGNKIWENQQPQEVIDLCEQYKPIILACDNIEELLLDPFLATFLRIHKTLKIVQVTANNLRKNRSVKFEANKLGIAILRKPRPLKTAILCAILAENGVGSIVNLKQDNLKIKVNYEEFRHTASNPIVKSKNKINLSSENTFRNLHFFLKNYPLIDSIISPVGFGKEANVYWAKDRNNEDLIIKAFRMYTPIAKKIESQNFNIRSSDLPLIMAKQEWRNLSIMEQKNIPVPSPKFIDNGIVGMEAIKCGKELALPLVKIKHNQILIDKEELISQIFDILLKLFFKCKIVHGDYSAYNLLFDGEKITVIDVSQAKSVNFNTFTGTPLRLRFDVGLEILLRDLNCIIQFFNKKFKWKMEENLIYSEFISRIPAFFLPKVNLILSKYQIN